MNKKFLSAILFGALMASSTGTFVSCKDYDDDIESINKELADVKSQLAALQAEVKSGNWVTDLVDVEGGFKVTFNNGKTYTIVNGKPGADGKPGEAGKGTKVEVKDGYWYLDGQKTEFVAVKKDELGKVKVPYVNADNMWVFFDKDGKEIISKYNALGATYVVEANGVFTLFVPDNKGEMQKVELPTAASMISSLKAELVGDAALAPAQQGIFNVDFFEFNAFKNVAADKKAAAKKAWKGTRAITTDKYIISSDEEVGMRIDPVSVDAKTIPFSLVDSKNNVPAGIALTAEEYKEFVTRAAYGNGLYTLSMKQTTLKDDAAKTAFADQFTCKDGDILFALNANNTFRSAYQWTVALAEATNKVFAPIYVGGIKVAADNCFNTANKQVTLSKAEITVNAGEEIKLSVENPSRLYDMWLEVAPEYVNEFGLVFDQTIPSFKVTKNPDKITAASFPMTIHVMDNEGNIGASQELTVKLSEAINTPAEYTLIEHAIKTTASKNYFSADLAIMKNALGNKLDSWKIKVNATTPVVNFYEDAACLQPVASAQGINTFVVSKVKNGTNAGDVASTGAGDANFLKFVVANGDACSKFEVNKVYYAKVTFQTKESPAQDVNSIVIPFKFTIPTLASMFVEEPAVFTDHVAYAYMTKDDQAGDKTADYMLSRAFAKSYSGATIELDNETAIVDGKTSKDLATLDKTTFGEMAGEALVYAKISLKKNVSGLDANRNGLQLGYGKELIVNASASDYAGWAYKNNEGKYTFKIKVLSPIFEGTVSAIKNFVEIPATSVEGYKVTNK